ncbi:MAG: regulatory protein RecX [Alphaproteobacteria bacterium]
MPHHKTDQVKFNTQNEDKPYNSGNSFKKKEKRPPKKITSTYLHNSGIYYLERFVASKAHFKSVMIRKVKRSCMHHKDQDFDSCAKMVDETADKLEEMGLLNDVLYTNGMVTSLRRKGMSRNAIIQKMRVKGIEPPHTIGALEKLDSEHHDDEKNAEISAALRLAKKKKMGPFNISAPKNSDDKAKETNKHLGRFARAGFSYQIARLVIDMSEEDLSEFDLYH